MRTATLIFAAAMLASPALSAKPPTLPAAIFTDPAPNKAHPARMEVLHIPSGGVEINGVAYLAAGAGAHPTLVLCRGWPGNAKNLDSSPGRRHTNNCDPHSNRSQLVRSADFSRNAGYPLAARAAGSPPKALN